MNRVREATALAGRGARRRRIVVDFARALGADWPEYPDAGGGLERARRPLAELERDPLRPARGERDPVAVRRPRRPGDAVSPFAGARARQGAVLPGRVPAADRADRRRVSVRALDRAHALPLQLGDDDDAREGNPRQAGGSVLRDPSARRGRSSGSPTATGPGSSRGAASSRRARCSASASTRGSSGWRSTSPTRR